MRNINDGDKDKDGDNNDSEDSYEDEDDCFEDQLGPYSGLGSASGGL